MSSRTKTRWLWVAMVAIEVIFFCVVLLLGFYSSSVVIFFAVLAAGINNVILVWLLGLIDIEKFKQKTDKFEVDVSATKEGEDEE